jgi:hypothetical protein
MRSDSLRPGIARKRRSLSGSISMSTSIVVSRHPEDRGGPSGEVHARVVLGFAAECLHEIAHAASVD